MVCVSYLCGTRFEFQPSERGHFFWQIEDVSGWPSLLQDAALRLKWLSTPKQSPPVGFKVGRKVNFEATWSQSGFTVEKTHQTPKVPTSASSNITIHIYFLQHFFLPLESMVTAWLQADHSCYAPSETFYSLSGLQRVSVKSKDFVWRTPLVRWDDWYQLFPPVPPL